MFYSGLFVPYGDHVVVHLLQLLLGDVHCVWRRVELVCLEGLVGEADLERLVILLLTVNKLSPIFIYRVFSYRWDVRRVGMRGSCVRGHEPEGRSHSRGDDIAPEGRGNAPPDCPGQHCGLWRGGWGGVRSAVDCLRC
jgi:hypothetical protein